jgi:hypothetical protein
VLSLLGTPLEVPLASQLLQQVNETPGPLSPGGRGEAEPLPGVRLAIETSLLSVNLDASLGASDSLLDVGAKAAVLNTPLAAADTTLGGLSLLGVDATVGAGNTPLIQIGADVAGDSLIDVDVDTGIGVGAGIGADPGIDIGVELPPVLDGGDVGVPPGEGDGSSGQGPLPGETPGVSDLPSSPTTPPTAATPLTVLPILPEQSATTLRGADTTARLTSLVGGGTLAVAAIDIVPEVGYIQLAEPFQEVDVVAVAEIAPAAVEEAFRVDEMPLAFTPENSGLFLDPSGLAAADLALQQFLNTLSELTTALLDWFATVGPTPFILMGLAALATMSEITRWRLQRVREIRRHAVDW